MYKIGLCKHSEYNILFTSYSYRHNLIPIMDLSVYIIYLYKTTNYTLWLYNNTPLIKTLEPHALPSVNSISIQILVSVLNLTSFRKYTQTYYIFSDVQSTSIHFSFISYIFIYTKPIYFRACLDLHYPDSSFSSIAPLSLMASITDSLIESFRPSALSYICSS